MRIAIFHELDSGGAKRAVVEFTREFYLLGNTVDLYFTGTKNEHIKGAKKAYFYLFQSRGWKGNDWKSKFYKDTTELSNLKKLHKKIAGEINKENYDFVFVHPSKFTQSPFVLRFLKKKTVYYCQESLRMAYEDITQLKHISSYKKLYEFLNILNRKRIDKGNIKKAHVVLTNSKFTKKQIDLIYGISSKVCYLGVRSDLFKPKSLRKTHDVLFVGRKSILEGYDLFLQFKKLNPQIRMHLLDNDKKYVTDSQLINLYNQSRIVVSLGKDEPFGLIPLEAEACGVPVVALNRGGYKETVENAKTGFLVNSIDELSQIVKKLLKSEKLRKKIGEQARKQMGDDWGWEKSAKKVLRYGKN